MPDQNTYVSTVVGYMVDFMIAEKVSDVLMKVC